MKPRPKLLDLYCGAGGMSAGYSRSGFDVVGVDIHDQPRYPFKFFKWDAIKFLTQLMNREFPLGPFIEDFDVIHASPPCQSFTNARTMHGRAHPDLLTPTRELLKKWGGQWVIENVPGAPMTAHLMLCGSMFGERRLIRHRCFEFSDPPDVLVPPCDHAKKTISVFGHGGHVYHTVKEWQEVMGIDWMNRKELANAIPPSYAFFIGKILMERFK